MSSQVPWADEVGECRESLAMESREEESLQPFLISGVQNNNGIPQ